MFDIGDKIWHRDEEIMVTVIGVSDNPNKEYRTYSLGQSEAQIAKWGKVNWVAWLDLKDVCLPEDK